MGNTHEGSKGSQYWMQKIANEACLKDDLDKMLGEKLIWISPLKDESYKEYMLPGEEKELFEKGKLPELEKVDFSFWPKTRGRKPTYDGIAISEDRGTLYLFEAKAHLTEMENETGAGADSLNVISKRMQEACAKLFGSGSRYNKEIWEKVEDKDKKKKPSFYQLGNRLTFLYYLNERRDVTNLPESIKIKLVLLNIVNDYTHNDEKKMISREIWEEHYKEVLCMMKYGDVSEEKKEKINIPENVEIIYFEPWKYERSELCKKG